MLQSRVYICRIYRLFKTCAYARLASVESYLASLAPAVIVAAGFVLVLGGLSLLRIGSSIVYPQVVVLWRRVRL